MNANIEQLLATKSYKELTTTERALVDTFMNKKEYIAARKVLAINTQQIAAIPKPSAAIKASLLQAMQASSSPKVPLYAQTVPIWQAMIAATILGFTAWFLLNSWQQPQIIEIEKEVLIASIDTFYQEVEVEVPVEIEKVRVERETVYVDRPVYVQPNLPIADVENTLPNVVSIETMSNKGRSAREDSVLMNLLTETY